MNNETGDVLADVSKIFRRFGFSEIPSKSHGEFILEEEALESKIKEIKVETLGLPICET